METPTKTCTRLPEAMLTEIQARLPLRSISRFKSVSKTWKSTLESLYFRRLFVSVHQNISSSWSLLLQRKELIDLHGCKIWGFPKSIASYIPNSETTGKFDYVTSSNGLVLIDTCGCTFVGNPVLQQWVEIPPIPNLYVDRMLGLVTHVDEDGVVLGFKVVKIDSLEYNTDSSTCLYFFVYSSETGVWTSKKLHCPRYFYHISAPMSLNGTFYLSSGDGDFTVSNALVAHDFYSESNLCRCIPLPDHNTDFRRALTTSMGFVMYVETLPHNVLKVWKLLNNDDDTDSAWQLEWEIRLPFDDISYYAPLVMHPFDRNIVYLWSKQKRYLVSCNLHTQDYKIFGEDQLKRYIDDDDLQNGFLNQLVRGYGTPIVISQFVLPRWMESMPCPPKLEMIDTTSLLSYISSMQKDKKK